MRPPEVNERLTRESSERERALALIRRKKREMAGSETPSTVHGGLDDEGVSNMFNQREVDSEAAKRYHASGSGNMNHVSVVGMIIQGVGLIIEMSEEGDLATLNFERKLQCVSMLGIRNNPIPDKLLSKPWR